jgi:hypothetical protein
MNAVQKLFASLRSIAPEHAEQLIAQYRLDAAADARASRQGAKERVQKERLARQGKGSLRYR